MTGVYDVTEAFNDLLVPVSIKPSSAGSYIEGKWVPGTIINSFIAEAVVHPMTLDEMNALTIAGYRGGKLLRFYFVDTVDVNITDNVAKIVGDVIAYDGESFIAIKKYDWKYQGGYQVVYAERSISNA